MICDICKQNTAIIHIQEIGLNGKHTLNLCAQCAVKRFIGATAPSGNMDKIAQSVEGLSQYLSNPNALLSILSQFSKHKGFLEALDDHTTQTQCPKCGRTWEDIKRTKQLGCEECINAFHKEIADILENFSNVIWNNYEKNIQMEDILPADAEEDDIEKSVTERNRQFEIERLKRELACAVKEENYERAARLRDLIAEFNPVNLSEQTE